MRSRSLSAFAAMAMMCAASSFASALDVGAKAPNFTLADQHGKVVKLSDYAGKVVVLEWFNDQCPFVQKQYKTGAMNATAAKYAEKGVVWLAINSSNFATKDTNEKSATDWKIDRPVLDDHDGKVGHLFGATNTPNMFVIDAKGTLVYKGAIDSVPSADPDDVSGATNYVAAALDQTLAGKPVTQSETKPYGCTVKY